MLTPAEVLELVPQQPPFRFIDRILAIDDSHAVTEYTYRPDEPFYAGHFPGDPLTPGVILLETMGQAVTALAIHLVGLGVRAGERPRVRAVMSDASIEVAASVRPGQKVVATAEKVSWRMRKLTARVHMALADGTLVATGTSAGMVSTDG